MTLAERLEALQLDLYALRVATGDDDHDEMRAACMALVRNALGVIEILDVGIPEQGALL